MKASSVHAAKVWDEFILADIVEERAFPHRGRGEKGVSGRDDQLRG